MNLDAVVNKLYLLQCKNSPMTFFSRQDILREFEGPCSDYGLKKILRTLEDHRKVISNGAGGYRLHSDYVNPNPHRKATPLIDEAHPSGQMMKLEDHARAMIKPTRGSGVAHNAVVKAKRDLFLAFRATPEEVMLKDADAWGYFLQRLSGWRLQLGLRDS
jgi:hypothetical protein